jgi:hypothetical protein
MVKKTDVRSSSEMKRAVVICFCYLLLNIYILFELWVKQRLILPGSFVSITNSLVAISFSVAVLSISLIFCAALVFFIKGKPKHIVKEPLTPIGKTNIKSINVLYPILHYIAMLMSIIFMALAFQTYSLKYLILCLIFAITGGILRIYNDKNGVKDEC